MIDPKVLRTDPDVVRRSQKARGASVELVDELVAADEARRSSIVESENLRAQQKAESKKIGQAKGDEKQQLLAQMKELSERVKEATAKTGELDKRFEEMLKQVGNIVLDGVPEGGEDDGVVLETVGTPRDFGAEGFEPKDHLEIGERLGAIDMERGTKISGSRFYVLTGIGAQLEIALLNLAMQKATEWGFTPMIPPALVKPEAMEGTGFLDQTEREGDAENKEVYQLKHDDLYLVGTSEVALAAYHSNEILEGLPKQYVAYSPCFRREAGSYGKDTRGIFRVHWFDKVELFVHCDPKDAEDWHQKLLGWEKEFLELLEIPYQVLDVASGDLGLSAARKYDCYAWLPTQERYREVTSTSNCTDFQARRLGIRSRFEDGTKPIATLNGTLCAMTRIIIMLFENHQQADGSVRIPEALRPFLGGREAFEPVN